MGNVTLEVDQGEDWTAQVIVSDQWQDPINVIEPIQMDIEDRFGQLILRMTVPEGPSTEVPEITYSSNVGMIQLHLTRGQTASLDPGTYVYDLFCTAYDNDVYAGNQRIRVIAGNLIVNQRVTEMTVG